MTPGRVIGGRIKVQIREILVEPAQAAPDIRFEFRLGHARLLEVQDVMEFAACHRAEQIGRLDRRTRQEGRIESHHLFEAVRRNQGRAPGDDSTPVVTNDRALVDPKLIEHPGEVGNQVAQRVGLDRLGTIGLAITPLVRRDGAESGGTQSSELMAPGVPDLREPVTKHHRVAFARFMQMHPDAVGLHELVFELAHERALVRVSLARRRRQSGRGGNFTGISTVDSA